MGTDSQHPQENPLIFTLQGFDLWCAQPPISLVIYYYRYLRPHILYILIHDDCSSIMIITFHNNWGVRSWWKLWQLWQLWHVDNCSSYSFYGLMWDVYIMHGFREPDGKVIRRYDLRAVFQAENIFLGHGVGTSTYPYIFTAHFMRLAVNLVLCKSRGTVIDHGSYRCRHLYIFFHSTHVVWIIYSDVSTRCYYIQRATAAENVGCPATRIAFVTVAT